MFHVYSRTSGGNFQFRCFFEQSIQLCWTPISVTDGDDRGDGVDGDVSGTEAGNWLLPAISSVIGREFMICLMALNSPEDITFSSLGFFARSDDPLVRKASTQGPHPSCESIQATMDYKHARHFDRSETSAKSSRNGVSALKCLARLLHSVETAYQIMSRQREGTETR